MNRKFFYYLAVIFCFLGLLAFEFLSPSGFLFTFHKKKIESSSLNKYINQLSEFENEFRFREMPDIEFFLFGMGNRTKILYKNGIL